MGKCPPPPDEAGRKEMKGMEWNVSAVEISSESYEPVICRFNRVTAWFAAADRMTVFDQLRAFERLSEWISRGLVEIEHAEIQRMFNDAGEQTEDEVCFFRMKDEDIMRVWQTRNILEEVK